MSYGFTGITASFAPSRPVLRKCRRPAGGRRGLYA